MAAKKRGLTYAQQAQIDTMKIAAANEGGGLAATGAQLAAGVGMGQMMAGAMAANLAAPTPSPQTVQTQAHASPQDANEPMQRLKKLKDLLDAGLIDSQEFESKKKEILSKI
jgi:membrane protease subunit (stomatin/prohibitin family)